MKKIMIIIYVLFGIGNSGSAQQKGDVEFGANLGGNFATITQDDNGRSNFNFNINAGVFADCYFSKQWSVKAKLIYDRKGGNKINVVFENYPDFKLVTDFKLDYITLPLMINWHFGETRKWYVGLGPYVGFLMSAEESELGLNIEDEFLKTDWELHLVLDIKFRYPIP